MEKNTKGYFKSVAVLIEYEPELIKEFKEYFRQIAYEKGVNSPYDAVYFEIMGFVLTFESQALYIAGRVNNDFGDRDTRSNAISNQLKAIKKDSRSNKVKGVRTYLPPLLAWMAKRDPILFQTFVEKVDAKLGTNKLSNIPAAFKPKYIFSSDSEVETVLAAQRRPTPIQTFNEEAKRDPNLFGLFTGTFKAFSKDQEETLKEVKRLDRFKIIFAMGCIILLSAITISYLITNHNITDSEKLATETQIADAFIKTALPRSTDDQLSILEAVTEENDFSKKINARFDTQRALALWSVDQLEAYEASKSASLDDETNLKALILRAFYASSFEEERDYRNALNKIKNLAESDYSKDAKIVYDFFRWWKPESEKERLNLSAQQNLTRLQLLEDAILSEFLILNTAVEYANENDFTLSNWFLENSKNCTSLKDQSLSVMCKFMAINVAIDDTHRSISYEAVESLIDEVVATDQNSIAIQLMIYYANQIFFV